MAAVVSRSASALRRSVLSTPIQSTLRPQYLKPASRYFSARNPSLVKKYTKDHEWIDLPDGSDIGTIGITNYAANALGDVVFVELPIPDADVSAGDSIGAVESVKSASDIMTPVSGKIVEANNVLEEKPGTINKGPEAEGWLAKIQMSDKGELKELMDADGYKAFTEEATGS